MESKVYRGENMEAGNKIIENSPKLMIIEIVKTEDGVGCAMATTNSFAELVKLAGKDSGWLENQMLTKLESISREVAKLVKELEDDVYKNAFAALQREMNSKNCN